MVINFWHTCFIFLKIIALAPISHCRNNDNSSYFKTSVKDKIHGFIFLTTYTVVHMCLVIQDLPKQEMKTSTLNLTLAVFWIIITFVIVVITILTFILRQKIAVDICNELYGINQLLETFKKNFRRKKIDKKLKLLTALNMFFCAIFPIIHYIFGQSKTSLWLIIFNTELISWIVVEYICIIALMGGMVEAINDEFQRFYDHPSLICDFFAKSTVEIDVLQEIYLALVKITKKYADFYGFIMLICVIKFFFGVLVEIFAIFRRALVEQGFIVKNFINPNVQFLLFWDIFILLSVTSSVTNLSDEVKNYMRLKCNYDLNLFVGVI